MTSNRKIQAAAGALLLACAWFFLSGGNSWPVRNAPADPGLIAAFGDSLTEGAGAGGEGKTYPDRLAAILGREVINAGRSGDTSGEGLARLEEDVLKHKPAAVFVFFGGNDMMRRVPKDETFDNLRAIVESCRDSGAVVALVGIEGIPLVASGYGRRYKALAKETGALFIPDILDGILGEPSLMSDRIHPNGEGYALMADRIAKALGPSL